MLPFPATHARMLRMIKQLDRIFDRYENWQAKNSVFEFERLLVPLADGDIRLKMHRLPKACLEAALPWRRQSSRSESSFHAFMKGAALNWMHVSGASDASCEAAVPGGRADVYSRKANWIIECGNTYARRLIAAIIDPTQPRFDMIPYQHAAFYYFDDERCGPSLIAVQFKWPPSLSPRMIEWLEEESCA